VQSADVCHARCIVIIGNEYTGKDIDVTGDNKEVNRDLYIVLTALELDSIFKFYIKLLRKHNRSADMPIVIQELYNESTASFLPDLYNVYSRVPHIWDPYEQKTIHSNRGIAQNEDEGTEEHEDDDRRSDVSNPYQSFKKHRRTRTKLKHLLDQSYVLNPAYSQGRVLTGPVIDTLTVQLLFNPNIVEFWQVAMGMKRYDDLYPETSDASDVLESLQSGCFDELEIPMEFQGTFGELFQYLLTCYGSIAIGLFRSPPLPCLAFLILIPSFRRNPENKSSYVAILPPHDSIVNPDDRVMVLLTNRPVDKMTSAGLVSPSNILASLNEEPLK
jgi:hypothetical protein